MTVREYGGTFEVFYVSGPPFMALVVSILGLFYFVCLGAGAQRACPRQAHEAAGSSPSEQCEDLRLPFRTSGFP